MLKGILDITVITSFNILIIFTNRCSEFHANAIIKRLFVTVYVKNPHFCVRALLELSGKSVKTCSEVKCT